MICNDTQSPKSKKIPQDNEEEKFNSSSETRAQIIVFPQKFIDPFVTYRMNGDFHLYSNARHIQHSNSLQLGISCQNPFKKITGITVDKELQQIILQYTQMDFTVTPWEMVVNRLESSGDSYQKKLSMYIQALYQQLNDKPQLAQKSIGEYRAFAQYQYRHIVDIDQIYISKVTFDVKFIEEMGFGLNQFIDTCLKNGIPEISLKPNSTQQEYYQNVIEFLKPLIEPQEQQEFYYYSHLYPEGLRTAVQFQTESQDDKEFTGSRIINLNIYLNYHPSKSNQQSMAPKRLRSKNCILQYYDIPENNYLRCGTKKLKI